MNKYKKLIALDAISSSILFSHVHSAEASATHDDTAENFMLSSLIKTVFDEFISIPTEKVSVGHRDLFERIKVVAREFRSLNIDGINLLSIEEQKSMCLNAIQEESDKKNAINEMAARTIALSIKLKIKQQEGIEITKPVVSSLVEEELKDILIKLLGSNDLSFIMGTPQFIDSIKEHDREDIVYKIQIEANKLQAITQEENFVQFIIELNTIQIISAFTNPAETVRKFEQIQAQMESLSPELQAAVQISGDKIMQQVQEFLKECGIDRS